MAPTIMLLTPNLDIGGAQEAIRTLAKYFPRQGADVVVCTFRDGALREEIEEMGVPVEVLEDRKHSVVSFPLFIAEMYRRRGDLLDLCDKYEVAVVQTQGLGSLDFLAMTLAARVDVWWTIQNEAFQLRKEHVTRQPWLYRAKRLAHRMLYFLGHSLISGVIAVSAETATSYADYARRHSKIFTVPNSVDTELYPARIERGPKRSELGVDEDETLGIVVATFKRQKGHEYLVAALDQVKDVFTTLKVALVGDGELRPQIEMLVQDRGLADRILFLGSRRDVPELLAASDLFILPSLWEGLSVALLEAMASEVPVIATDVSGTRSLIIDGATGVLVPPGDVASLAASIRAIEADDEIVDRALRARALVNEHYSGNSMAKKLVEIFAPDLDLDLTALGTTERE